jgi:hypothetical protein
LTEAGEFSIDLYTMPDQLTKVLWDHLVSKRLITLLADVVRKQYVTNQLAVEQEEPHQLDLTTGFWNGTSSSLGDGWLPTRIHRGKFRACLLLGW